MEDSQRVFIRGNKDREGEVIKALEDCGASNSLGYIGDYDTALYFINHNGIIDSTRNYNAEFTKIIMDRYTELYLPEKWKDGDILIKNDETCYKVFLDYDLSLTTFYTYVSISITDEKIISNKEGVCICDRKDYRLATPSEVERFHELLHKHDKDWDTKKRLLVNWKCKPKYGDMYWIIDTDGSVKAYTWNEDSVDNRLFNLGNYFRTRKEAETMAEKFKKLLKGKL